MPLHLHRPTSTYRPPSSGSSLMFPASRLQPAHSQTPDTWSGNASPKRARLARTDWPGGREGADRGGDRGRAPVSSALPLSTRSQGCLSPVCRYCGSTTRLYSRQACVRARYAWPRGQRGRVGCAVAVTRPAPDLPRSLHRNRNVRSVSPTSSNAHPLHCRSPRCKSTDDTEDTEDTVPTMWNLRLALRLGGA